MKYFPCSSIRNFCVKIIILACSRSNSTFTKIHHTCIVFISLDWYRCLAKSIQCIQSECKTLTIHSVSQFSLLIGESQRGGKVDFIIGSVHGGKFCSHHFWWMCGYIYREYTSLIIASRLNMSWVLFMKI